MFNAKTSCGAAVSLAAILGCGGGGGGGTAPTTPPPPAAVVIDYQDPVGVPSGSFSLNKNQALSVPATHLVLDLHGPATTIAGSGVVLTLHLDPAKAAWGSVSGGSPVANGTVFSSSANGGVIIQGKVNGGTLQVVATERGFASAKAFNAPLLRVALDLRDGQNPGSVIDLAADLNLSQVLLGDGSVIALQDVRVGLISTR